ncbi:heavy-metal-associated domain-containing protein [Planococcus salinarum]|uniref:heavy-metal-associated domain-containing protein n=1 Tax=Planococcus salinarum TaxID=622695 RepID=UPI000E3D9465|nr:heavy-metal-associated domain-containing protein [Planococcus salinarum]TAA73527.1 copper chaperone [Planococcus salinarum]
MKTMTIFVKEATAEKSIQSLEEVLAGVPEIERALVDVEDGEVTINYDENQISEDQIIRRVQLEGFHIL